MVKTLACNICNSQVYGDCVACFAVTAETHRPVEKPLSLIHAQGDLWCKKCEKKIEKSDTHEMQIASFTTRILDNKLPIEKCPKCKGAVCAEVTICTAEVDVDGNIIIDTIEINYDSFDFEYFCGTCYEEFEMMTMS